MAKNTQGWQTPTGKQALDALKDAKPMSQVYQENFAKAVADKTKELLKQNQKSAEHPTTQVKQATSAATQEPKTTKQKYEESKKNLSDYTKSDDYKARQQERNREALKKSQEGMFSTGGTSESPRSMVFAGQEDAREKELKALVNHYKQQMDAEENQRIRDADMKEIDSWSDEDRAALDEYVRARDERDDPLTVSNPFRYILQANKAAKPYSALAEKYGEKRLAELAESYGRVQHEEDAQKIVGDTTAAVSTAGGAIGHNILSVGANGIGGFLGILGRVNEAFNRTGRYTTLEDYTPGDALSLYASTVRGATTQNIEGENGGVWRKALSVGYQGIMSLADSISRGLALGPAGGATLAATGSFSQTVSEATKQGASPQQAVALGVAKAGMEYATEKIPMDEVFKIAKSGKTNVLAQAFKQAGVEITTEELSLFGSMAAEAAILQEKSSYKQKIGELVANGASYEEAKAQADKGVWNEVLQTAAVSGFAGSVSGGGAAIVGNLTTNNAPDVTEEVQQELPVQTPPEAPAVDEGRQIVDAVAAELAQQAPQPEVQPASPEMEQLDMTIAETLGVQPAQQPTVDTDPAAEYDNSNVSPDLGASVGNSGVTYTSDNQAVPFQYAVVPAESLITSNDQFGNVNSAYPAELQPRDRTRTASQIQISKMAQNLNPALLAESATAENGAPIIRGDGVVVGGNARVNAIGMAYSSGNGGAYQQFITEKAAELGIDPATLPANPVLVRITNGVDNYTGLATALNETGVKTNSPSETAKIDASKMGDIIQYLSVGEDGDLNTAENREFIQKFTTHVVPSGEQDTVMQGNSQVSQAGVRRMQYALFHYAYNDTALLERLAESTDNNAKNITNAMVGTAGKVAKLQTEINRGEAQDLGLQNAITDAVNIYLDAKAGKQTVDDAVGQLSIGENGPEAQYDGLAVHLAKFMEANNRSGQQIRKFIDILVDVNMNTSAETATEVSMFDTVEQQTQEGLYDEAVTAYDQQRDGKGRIPEKSDFSQYRQYQPGELAGSMDGSGTEGNSGTAVSDGGIPQTIQGDVPGGQRNLAEQNPGIKGTGAAEGNFSGKPAYNATLSEDNSQADRRDDVRPMELPQQDVNGGNVSAVTGNVYGSRITPDEFASLMEEPTARGDFSYAKITNDKATQLATETIASAGTWENAYDGWKQSVSSGNAGAEMSARGALLLNHAAQQGNKQLWLETLHYMQKLGTNTAQGLQALRIIRTLQPADKVQFVKMSVEKMVADVKEKHGIDIELDQNLIDEFENADTDEARDGIIADIQQDIASQIPSTFLDKWTALRYMNMLGNLKTNVRNFAGNVGSAAVYRVKDTIATGMEYISHVVSGGKTDRTKSLFVSKSLLNACKEDFNQFKETVSSGGKYGERMSASNQFEQGVQDKRRIFKNPVLEAYRKGTNWMMNNGIFGDEAFGRAAYSRALAGYLQANGVNNSDLSKVDAALLDKARAYAINEAQEATFHDNSALARIVSKVQKDTGIVGQGLMPFTKTPANVLTRAEEFSPLGLINSTVKSIQKARGNVDISGADVINSWAKSITGVGLFALGAAMMDQGLLTGGPDEDDEKAAFDNLNGQQNYALRLPDGTNYTIDWLTPAAMPMFMGAQFWKMLSSDRDLTFADMEQVFTSIADPMIQMSMLQGLNDSLDGIKHSDNNLGQFFINAAVSYLTQGLTNTLMGQIERSTEENRQTTYIDKNSGTPEWLQRQLGKASQKIPGWDYQQMDYRNAWGQTEKNEGGLAYNLLSPGYVSKEQNDRITQELYRLRETTGENVFPQKVGKTVTYTDINGTKRIDRTLTQDELDTIQQVEGQTAMRIMAEIVMNDDYNSLTDTQRAAVISNVYQYAQEQGKKEALSDYYSEESAWIQNMGDDVGNALIQKAVLDYAKNSLSVTQDAKKNGFSDEIQNMNDRELKQSYDVYSKMSQEAKEAVREDATGTLSLYLEARDDGMKHKDFMYLLDGIEEVKPGKSHTSDIETYLEIRDQGVSEEQFLSAVGSIASLKPEGEFKNVREIQQREAIANLNGVPEKIKDVLMKAYMDDGDTTEAKYDYCRNVLDLSPQEYVQAYRVQLDGGKKNEKISKWKSMGYTQEEANIMYRLFAATGKTKIDSIDWADSWK